MATAKRTIHVNRDQWNLAWDSAIPPIARIDSGDTVSFDMLDASNGQIGPGEGDDAIVNLDFGRVDQVNGPVYVEGARPGDTLQVEFVDLRPADWGWIAIIPGFDLLADEFDRPALKIWHLDDGFAEFTPGIRIPLDPFRGEIGPSPRVMARCAERQSKRPCRLQCA